MGNLRKYLELQTQAKTGLSSGLFVCGLVAVVFGILTAAFILLIAFIWLAERYGALLAAAILAGLFLVVTIVAIVCSLQSRRRTTERAEVALAAQTDDLARPEAGCGCGPGGPRRRLAQVRSAARPRRSRRHRWNGMGGPQQAGERER